MEWSAEADPTKRLNQITGNRLFNTELAGR